MKKYKFDCDAVSGAAIWEEGSQADGQNTCLPDTPGLVVGCSEWIWMSEDNARRICAALEYFSEFSTERIEQLAALKKSKK